MDSNCVESGSEGFNESQENQKHEALTATTSDLWKITENGIAYTGGKNAILGTGNYENFELWFEWKGTGKAGLGVRSIRQIDLGGDKSGALSGNIKTKIHRKK